jgi:gas vesicle protein
MAKNGLLGGLAIGAAVGAVIGLALAPRQGKETRAILKKTASALPQIVEDIATNVTARTLDTAAPIAERVTDIAIDRWYDTLDRFQDAMAAGVNASRDFRQQSRDLE